MLKKVAYFIQFFFILVSLSSVLHAEPSATKLYMFWNREFTNNIKISAQPLDIDLIIFNVDVPDIKQVSFTPTLLFTTDPQMKYKLTLQQTNYIKQAKKLVLHIKVEPPQGLTKDMEINLQFLVYYKDKLLGYSDICYIEWLAYTSLPRVKSVQASSNVIVEYQDFNFQVSFDVPIAYIPDELLYQALDIKGCSYTSISLVPYDTYTVKIFPKNLSFANVDLKPKYGAISFTSNEVKQTVPIIAKAPQIAQSIEKQFPINIYIGTTESLQRFSYTGIGCQDNQQILQLVIYIQNALSHYDPAFINQVLKDGILNIYLMQEIQPDLDGLTLVNYTQDIITYNLFLTNNHNQAIKTFHHEFMHIVEYSNAFFDMNHKQINNLFKSWTQLNPKGFKYTSTAYTHDYVFNAGKVPLSKSYFTTVYAKTSEYEDRACLFAELMSSDLLTNQSLSKLDPLYAKIMYLNKELQRVYPYKNPYWMRNF